MAAGTTLAHVNARLIFILSLALNLALAGWLAWRLERPRGEVVSEEHDVVPAAGTPRPRVTITVPAEATAPVRQRAEGFRWEQLETRDLAQLALNLRAVGCPEKTVRELVLARARRVVDRITRETEPALPFWAAGTRRELANRQSQQLVHEKVNRLTAQLRGVFGSDFVLDDAGHLEDFEEQALLRFVMGPLPEDSLRKVVALMARYEDRREEILDRAMGVWLDEDEAAQNQLAIEDQRELGGLLTAPELEELLARNAMVSQFGNVKFEYTDLQPREIRQLALLRARFGEPFALEQFRHGALTEEQEAALKAATREFLGEKRFAEFERAADYDFRALYELGEEQHLPRSAAEKVYDLHKLAAEEMEQVRADNSLSETDRRQRLAQVLAEAQQATLRVLGPVACGQYLDRGGQWLTNVTGL